VNRRGEQATQAPAPPPPAPEPLRVPVPDAHTHLDLQDTEVAAAVAAAAAVGVDTLIQIGIDVPSSRWSARIAAEHERVWATVALHPNEAPRLPGPELEAALAQIEELAGNPVVRGIGETGLDHYRTEETHWAVQEESFRRHIDIAKRFRKTLVIHDRDAHDDVLRVLLSEGAPERVVFHCFSGDAQLAKVCTERGYVMSFAGNVTYRNNQHLRDALSIAPLGQLLVETDAPFLTPLPHRGRPNAPYLIPLTLRAMAQVKATDEETLGAEIAATAQRMFGPF
jgi:TatD DNase family protein